WAQNVSLTLENSVLDSNAALFGAGIHSASPYATVSVITGTTISKNTATRGGGLYFSGGSSLHIADSVLDSNTGTTQFGGGRLYRLPFVLIERTRITNNKSQTLSGGGLSIDGHNVTYALAQIAGSTITGNTAGNDGGGLALFRVDAILTSDTISGNSANNGGGIFVFDPQIPPTTQLTLQQSTISGNTGSTLGGGIYVERALGVNVTRSLISSNNAYDPAGGGGGIAISYVKNTTQVNDSTIYANYAYNNGGGVGIFNASGVTAFNGVTIANNFTFNYASNGILGAGNTSLYNCVVANNFSHAGNQDLDGGFAEDYSLVRNAGTAVVIGFHNKNGVDPMLGPLAVNGGPTQTMLPSPSSPLLDAGGFSLGGLDQRGLPRNANGRRDMGAVERQYPEDVIFRNGFDSS
ncbi:MAG TPA: choice-of-anchor Q domain-containing protein, partial [Rhodanobacteraceae bacterium]|nr:choice-of-anchor Q domain-containing protein [Rhodanobacteraceae bacterium]